jgi:hypothetical protein
MELECNTVADADEDADDVSHLSLFPNRFQPFSHGGSCAGCVAPRADPIRAALALMSRPDHARTPPSPCLGQLSAFAQG